MKIRTGFVSNSSSSSFIIQKDTMTPFQQAALLDHMHVAETLLGWDDCAEFDSWGICESGDHYQCGTSMTNFDLRGFLTSIGYEGAMVEKDDFYDGFTASHITPNEEGSLLLDSWNERPHIMYPFHEGDNPTNRKLECCGIVSLDGNHLTSPESDCYFKFRIVYDWSACPVDELLGIGSEDIYIATDGIVWVFISKDDNIIPLDPDLIKYHRFIMEYMDSNVAHEIARLIRKHTKDKTS